MLPTACAVGLRYLLGIASGIVIGRSLEGEVGGVWYLVLTPALIYAAWLHIIHPRDWIANFLLVVGFYAGTFSWLLGAFSGVMGGGWMVLTLLFASLQTVVVFCSATAINKVEHRVVAFPFALVSAEFARHLFVKLCDGNGLPLCLLGQIPADNHLLIQIADVGGVWGLSFLVGLLSVGILVCFIPDCSRGTRYCVASAAVLCLGMSLVYGSQRINYFEKQLDATIGDGLLEVWLIDKRVGPTWIPDGLGARIAESSSSSSTLGKLVLFPEVAVNWNSATPTAEQLELLNLARNSDQTCVIGVRSFEQDDGSSIVRNSCVVIKQGKIVATVDKCFLVPFLENRLWLASLLVVGGIIPEHMLNVFDRSTPIDTDFWRDTALCVRPSICYDVFFPESFRRFPTTGSAIHCCLLSEEFDAFGGYRRLSRLHAKLRSVEFRRPLASCSLGGFSGVFDETGKRVEPTAIHEGISYYHVAPIDHVTFYAIWGEWFPKLCLLICANIVIWDWYQRRVTRKGGKE
jgi:apolipoprotein N-acyltransferase